MALIIYPEDGWDSLVTLAEAQSYMTSYGHDWPAEEGKQEIALRKGTQYLMAAYQIDPKHLDPIDAKIKAACCEAAVRSLAGPLLADTDGRIKTEQTTDVITTKWAEGSQGGRKTYPVIDALMRGLASNSAMMVRLVRG